MMFKNFSLALFALCTVASFTTNASQEIAKWYKESTYKKNPDKINDFFIDLSNSKPFDEMLSDLTNKIPKKEFHQYFNYVLKKNKNIDGICGYIHSAGSYFKNNLTEENKYTALKVLLAGAIINNISIKIREKEPIKTFFSLFLTNNCFTEKAVLNITAFNAHLSTLAKQKNSLCLQKSFKELTNLIVKGIEIWNHHLPASEVEIFEIEI